MSGFLRCAMLLSVLCCPTMAAATAPTPQGIAHVERLLGLNLLYDHLFDEKFLEDKAFDLLEPAQRTCFFETLRSQFHDVMSRHTGEMFVDEETVAAWIRFSATRGGSKLLGAVKASVTAPMTGQPKPDLAAIQAAMDPEEMMDVSLFESSPAAAVMGKPFPQLEIGDTSAQTKRAAEGCGIVRANS
jgi:hypothetical protein